MNDKEKHNSLRVGDIVAFNIGGYGIIQDVPDYGSGWKRECVIGGIKGVPYYKGKPYENSEYGVCFLMKEFEVIKESPVHDFEKGWYRAKKFDGGEK